LRTHFHVATTSVLLAPCGTLLGGLGFSSALLLVGGSSWNRWAAIPSSVVIAYFLLGIEELAAQMEVPFSILHMDKMT
jgi:hypothetical protein